MPVTLDLEGKVALVTGGASGLGLATATRLAEAGARVIINDLREDAAIAAAARLGIAHLGVGGDVSIEEDVAAFVAKALIFSGGIDILVNNAGITDNFTPTVDQTLAHWRRLTDIHLTGTFLVSRTVARSMITRDQGGAIINVSSIAGVIGLPVRTAYSAAKAGIGMMTRVLASEWGPARIRVNAVAPGWILTPALQALINAGKNDPAVLRRRTPMGALGRPEHVADATLFLASDLAAFITGAILPVDGGYMAYGAATDAFVMEDQQ